jgi:hypothetical protein
MDGEKMLEFDTLSREGRSGYIYPKDNTQGSEGDM